MSVIPLPDPDARRQRIILGGDVPSPVAIPDGCRFSQRWLYEQLGQPENCTTVDPQLRQTTHVFDQRVACHYAERSSDVLEHAPKEAIN